MLSIHTETAKRLEEVSEKNEQAYKELLDGEEGVDYISTPKGFVHPDLPNPKLFERQVREEIKVMKLSDPEKAEEYEKMLLHKNLAD